MKTLTLDEIDLAVVAWNAAHAEGHQLTSDEEAELMAMLDAVETKH